MTQHPPPSTRRHALRALGATVLAAGAWPLAAPALAADPPPRGAANSGTLRIVIPFAAGGTADVVARLLADRLGQALGQTAIVEPRPGANGIIASDLVAKAAPDGNTLLLASAAHASNASLYPKLPYDTARDFTPVALVAPPGPMVIAVNAELPVRTVRELVAYARANPGKLAYASAGIGNTLHLAGEMFSQMAGVQMLHVPYKGAAPALNDLAGGQVQLMFNSALAVAPMVKAGRLRLIAQTGLQRSPALPADLPTVAESGIPALQSFQVTGWFGLFAPARTPTATVQRIGAEVLRAMALPELRDKLALLGSSEPPTSGTDTPASAFGSFVSAETARYASVIQAAGLRLDTPTQ